MKLITNKSKNLLYCISVEGNVTVQFGTSYAVATQRTADSSSVNTFKIQGWDGTKYTGLAGANIAIGKLTTTFTTPSTTGFKLIRFGLNGASIDTLCRCEMDLKPSTTYTFTCNFTNITQGSVSWKDMMLVEGSVAGEYEPYSYNLLDKWQYPATQTLNGVTFTNNGDGSITANGTNTGDVRIFLPVAVNMNLKDGHYYCMSGNVSDWSVNTYCTVFEIVGTGADREGETIFKYTEPSDATGTKNGFYIRVSLGVTVNNAIFKPQLYDLTLMYGAGNEPTTVDQFYTDYPELTVSPLGFIGLKNLEISNKNIKRLKYQTGIKKNLFNINNYSIIGEDIGFDISGLEIGKTYTISCNQSNFKWVKISNSPDGHNSVATHPVPYNKSSFTFVMSRNSNIPETATQYIFLQMMNSTSSGFARNLSELGVNQIQIEEGSIATYYVDYKGCLGLGIIPSNSGYILNKYNNLSEELLEENIEKDTVNYHIPDKTNILLNKVDGKTNKIVQEIDVTKTPATTTKNGITCTNNRDGSWTVNGASTATEITYFIINNENTLPAINGHIYCTLGCPSGGAISSYRIESSFGNDEGNGVIYNLNRDIGYGNVYISIGAGYTANRLIFRPQVFDLTAMYGFGNEPTTVEQFKKDYPQFFDEKLDGIWNVRTSGISTTGKNLFDISKWITSQYDVANGTLVERLSNGAICQGNSGDGSASYSNGWFRPMLGTFPLHSVNLQAGTYTLSADYTMIENSAVSTAQVSCHLYGDNNYPGSAFTSVTVGSTVKVKNTYTVEEGNYYPIFTLNSGKAKIENIQIELNSTATTYEPYTENKIDLSSTQTLNGINGVNDYIEVIDKGNGLYDLKKTQNIDSVDLGTLDWVVDGSNFSSSSISSVIKTPINNSTPANCVCNKYVNCSIVKSFIDGDFGVNTDGIMQFRDSSYSTAAAFKTAVSGVYFYYQLKTPVTTTIATDLTYNQVSAIRTNGGLLLVNDNNNQKYAQPNVIIKSNYQYKS